MFPEMEGRENRWCTVIRYFHPFIHVRKRPIYASGTGVLEIEASRTEFDCIGTGLQEYWERKPLHFRAAERGSSLAALCFRSVKCSNCMIVVRNAGLL